MDNIPGYRKRDDRELVMEKQEWVKAQDVLKNKLILEDDFEWSLPSAPILLGLFEKMKTSAHHFYPQLLMIDGNGLLHPRCKPRFVLACHIGVLADLPTIGVGKNLHHVDGLNQSEVRRQLEAKGNCNKELISLTGQPGTTWGAAMRCCAGSSKPIHISVGHGISLDSTIGIVKFCGKYRVPKPTCQSDIRSKVLPQKHQRLQK